MKNNARIRFDALSQNEAFARICVSAFVAGANPNLEELNDIKTAVSEAVTNAIVHGYSSLGGEIEMVM
jgi:stage II sporulation protein AB (anti-sigma F factor)